MTKNVPFIQETDLKFLEKFWKINNFSASSKKMLLPPPCKMYAGAPSGGSRIFIDHLSLHLQLRLNILPEFPYLLLILLSRLLYITELKYWNQLKKFRKFRVVLSSGSHETGSTAKKVTASDSA